MTRVLDWLRATSAGTRAVLLLAPHLVLGTWLFVVPDELAFRFAQVATLVHALVAIASTPLLALWAARHVVEMRSVEHEAARATGAGWLLVACGAVALVTGAWVVQGGDIVPVHRWHAAAGLLTGVVLALHLWRGGRPRAAAWLLALPALLFGIGECVVRWRPAPPAEPAFAFVAHSSSLYEPAADCGECHEREYAEWVHSSHGRTMHNPSIQRGLQRQPESIGYDLARYGALMRGTPHPGSEVGELVNSCERCHTPTTFYGDDHVDPRRPTGVAREGITCSFCHTVRGVHTGVARHEELPATLRTAGLDVTLPRLPYYVSSPESVRRYFGEGSTLALARWLGRALVRWRPSVHRHDMRSPALDTAEVCLPCHSSGDYDRMPELPQKTFAQWEQSEYARTKRTTCQDCHMAATVTGEPSRERGSFVPWGPIRDGHVSHFFLGGNRRFSREVFDEQHEAREHALNQRSVTMTLGAVRRSSSQLEVDVRLASSLVGHDLPSSAAQNRWLWVEVKALDAHGATLAVTPTPKQGDEVGGPTPIAYRCVEPARADCATALAPGVPRDFTARVVLPAGAAPARIVATLYTAVDSESLATQTAPVP